MLDTLTSPPSSESETGKNRVLLLDSEQLTLAGLSCLLTTEANYQIIGNAQTGQDGLNLALQVKPDLVLIDTNLEGYSPYFVAEEIKRNIPETKLVFFSRHFSDTVIERCLKIPCDAMVLKTEGKEVLLKALDLVFQGKTYFSEELSSRIDTESGERQVRFDSATPLSELTSRQLEVLHHLAKGNSVKEVAKIMHLSEKSIDSHKYRIMNRLGIHDRVKLSLYAVREGLIQP